MRLRVFLFLLLIALFLLLTFAEAKKKRKGLKIKTKKPKISKKVKRFFAVKHKKKKEEKPTTTTTQAFITPTLTTFTAIPVAATPVLLTITDRDYNYFFGYAATAVNGAKYYNSPNYLVAGPRRCGCADSHPIIVTRIPEDIEI